MEIAEKFMLRLYGAKTGIPSNQFRLMSYQRAIARRDPGRKEFDLCTILLTAGASQQHGLRVYLQVQEWLGNELNPEKWGWYKAEDEDMFRPVPTLQKAAPDHLLKMLFCTCANTCGPRCPCGQSRCSAMWTNCAGHACGNQPDPESVLHGEDTTDPDDVEA